MVGKSELRDPVAQHPARIVERFEDLYPIAEPHQIAGTGEPRRSGAHDRHLLGPGLGELLVDPPVLDLPVGEEALQEADSHRLEFLPQMAVLLTLALLGTDPAAHRRKAIDLLQGAKRILELPLGDQSRHLPDRHQDRTALLTGGLLTLETAHRLELGSRGIVAPVDLMEEPATLHRVEHRHLGLLIGLDGHDLPRLRGADARAWP